MIPLFLQHYIPKRLLQFAEHKLDWDHYYFLQLKTKRGTVRCFIFNTFLLRVKLGSRHIIIFLIPNKPVCDIWTFHGHFLIQGREVPVPVNNRQPLNYSHFLPLNQTQCLETRLLESSRCWNFVYRYLMRCGVQIFNKELINPN